MLEFRIEDSDYKIAIKIIYTDKQNEQEKRKKTGRVSSV